MKSLSTLLAAVLVAVSSQLPAHAQPTAFTYQGFLTVNGAPANGTNDFEFKLYNAATLGAQQGETVTLDDIGVTNGLFTVTLDFVAEVFDGSARWLDIAIRPGASSGAYTNLIPRQPVTATPYAIKAGSLSGVVPAGGLSGTYSEALNLTNAANAFTGAFTGDGSGLTNVAAATLGGLSVSNFWQQGGNAGTAPGTNFVGTTDNQPLELRVNGQRVMRLEPAPETPNVIGGSGSNAVAAGVRAATIAGGGLPAFPNLVTADFATVGGGTFHIAGGGWSTIAGGRDNRAYGESSGILSGRANVVESNSLGSVIVGGEGNLIRQGNIRAFIGSGFQNIIDSNANYSVIGGGFQNTNHPASPLSVIGGGLRNSLGSNAVYSVLAGGFGGFIGAGSRAAVLGGGEGNRAAANHATVAGGLNNLNTGPGATIGGGNGNVTPANDTVIAGGIFNAIGSNAFQSVISGGRLNMILSNAQNATIGGGNENVASAGEATVSGGALNRAAGFATTIGGGTQNASAGEWTTLGGGFSNMMETNLSMATIAGGWLNSISDLAYNSTVGGGYSNRIQTNAYAGTIAGGEHNTVVLNAWRASIGGGSGNRVLAATGGTIAGGVSNTVGGSFATVPGGFNNSAAGLYSQAAGRRASAAHSGAFVWADSQNADFASTAGNQFLVRASGGVGINTNNPSAALHVGGTPGVDGIRFPDGTLQTTAAAPSTPPAVVFSNGSGSSPTTVNSFLATTATVVVTSSSQRILVTSHKAFGSTAAGGANALNLFIGYRPSAGGVITNVGDGVFGNQVAQNMRITMGLSAVITGLAPGSYVVGLTGSSTDAVNWNSNEFSYTTAVVY